MQRLIIITALALASASALAQPRVISGQEAERGQYPDAVYVLPGCTGTLIAPNLVLTADHCVESESVFPTAVVVNSTAPETEGRVVGVERAIKHPVGHVEGIDVAVLILEEDVATKPRVIAHGCAQAWVENGADVIGAGFGLRDYENDSGDNPTLNYTALTISDVDCSGDYSEYGERWACWANREYMFLASSDDSSSCYGDSGGPLYLQTDVGELLVGVVHGGDSECRAGVPNIYIRADRVVDWIQEVTGVELAEPDCSGQGDDDSSADDDQRREDESDAGEGGCSATGSADESLLLLLLAALLALARRRRVI